MKFDEYPKTCPGISRCPADTCDGCPVESWRPRTNCAADVHSARVAIARELLNARDGDYALQAQLLAALAQADPATVAVALA